MNTTKKTIVTESRRSNIPPWPGIKLEKSLTSKTRLTIEKNKSPRTAKIDNTKDKQQ